MRDPAKFPSVRLLVMLAAGWWGILNGQTVPAVAGGTGTVVLRIQSEDGDDTPTQHQGLDTLELRLLQVDIRKWEAKVEETSFWTRLLPQIHFSAGYGMRDLMFIDPTSFTPYILPRDAYRLTVSLSLNDVLMPSAHTQAILELEKLRETLSIRRIQHAHERTLFQQQLTAIRIDLESLEKEHGIVRDLLRFNQLRFDQGKIEYDALARTKLELLSLQRSIDRMRHQQSEIQLRLTGK